MLQKYYCAAYIHCQLAAEGTRGPKRLFPNKFRLVWEQMPSLSTTSACQPYQRGPVTSRASHILDRISIDTQQNNLSKLPKQHQMSVTQSYKWSWEGRKQKCGHGVKTECVSWGWVTCDAVLKEIIEMLNVQLIDSGIGMGIDNWFLFRMDKK